MGCSESGGVMLRDYQLECLEKIAEHRELGSCAN